jgi:hypothetical protein
MPHQTLKSRQSGPSPGVLSDLNFELFENISFIASKASIDSITDTALALSTGAVYYTSP